MTFLELGKGTYINIDAITKVKRTDDSILRFCITITLNTGQDLVFDARTLKRVEDINSDLQRLGLPRYDK